MPDLPLPLPPIPWTAALLALAAACGDDPPPAAILEVEIVAPDGSDPTAGADHARIDVAQPGTVPIVRDLALGSGNVGLDVPFMSGVPIDLRVTITGAGIARLGALPLFVREETGGFVRIVVGDAGSCAMLANAELALPRAQGGVAIAGTFALIAGGEPSGSTADGAEYVDLLRAHSGTFEVVTARFGPAHAVALTRDLVLVAGDERDAIVDLSQPADRERPITLHEGAGSSSTVLSLGDRGAVVIGGASGGGAVDAITWVRRDGTTATTRLAQPRQSPAVAPLGSALLVAGGVFGGSADVELVSADLPTGTPLLDLPAASERSGAALIAGPDRFLLFGGTTAAGQPIAETLVISGCPDACSASPGPAWERPRAAAAHASLPDGSRLILGGAPPGASFDAAIDLVRFDGDTPAIEAHAPLAAPRAGAAAASFGPGLVLVAGGVGPGGPRADSEVCFPAAFPLP